MQISMLEDILNFEVRFYSTDGVSSPVISFIRDLLASNKNLALRSLEKIPLLPKLLYLFQDVKHFKVGKISFYELLVRSGKDIYRFFFATEKPNLIIVYRFVKKSQKTDKQDIENGLKFYKDYLINQKKHSHAKFRSCNFKVII